MEAEFCSTTLDTGITLTLRATVTSLVTFTSTRVSAVSTPVVLT